MENQIECYKHPEIIKEVFEATSRIASQISNTARLENDILNDIGGYLIKEVGNYRKKRYIRRIIHSKISVSRRRNRNEHATFLIDENTFDGEGQAIEYEPEDVLADINSGNMEIKETIELLAQGDRRNKMILNAWANGYTEAKEISSILADALGGNSESHRKHIQRFKKTCRTGLTAQAI